MTLASVLPLTFVMVAGPQFISAVFFATSVNWKGTSAAYVLGAAVSITGFYSAAYFLAKEAKGGGPGGGGGRSDTVSVVVLVLLVVLALHVFLSRKQAEPPKWMGRLQTATPRFAFLLGLLLLGVFPTDLLTSVSAGSHVANDGGAWADGVPFIALTLLLLALPSLLVVLLGQRAKAVLPKVRDWMDTNSWVVSEIVIVFFIVLTIDGMAA